MDTKICTFEKIFNQLPNKKINVISTCLFKLKNSYKNFNAYLYRAKNVKLLAQKLKFYLLVFIDDSIYNNKDIYKNKGIPFVKLLDNELSSLILENANSNVIKIGIRRFIKFFNFEIDFVLILMMLVKLLVILKQVVLNIVLILLEIFTVLLEKQVLMKRN